MNSMDELSTFSPVPQYSRIKDYLDLFRASLAILTCFAVLSGGFIVYSLEGNGTDFISYILYNEVLDPFGITLGLCATVLLVFAIQSINDYFDVETDIANKRFDRPIARGAFQPKFVLYLSSSFFIIATILISILVTVFHVTLNLLLFTLFFIFVGISYNLGFKEKGFLGNVWVSIGYLAPLFIGFFLFNPTQPLVVLNCYFIISATFLIAIGREIVKDIQDYEGDKTMNLPSLPVKIGIRKAAIVAFIFFILTLICIMISGLLIYKNLVFWIFYFILTGILGLTGFTIFTNQPDYGKKTRKYTRWSMWIALLSFFLGIFFIPQNSP